MSENISEWLKELSEETLFNLSLTEEFSINKLPENTGTSVFLSEEFWTKLTKPLSYLDKKQPFNISKTGTPQAAFKRFHEADKKSLLSRIEKKEIALWMASIAAANGLPPELPVMAALTETGDTLRNLLDGDRDSVGFFQIRVGQHDNGSEIVSTPEGQLKWFVKTANHSPNGRTGRENKWTKEWFLGQISQAKASNNEELLASLLGKWCQDIERSGYPDRYEKRYNLAKDLIYGQ